MTDLSRAQLLADVQLRRAARRRQVEAALAPRFRRRAPMFASAPVPHLGLAAGQLSGELTMLEMVICIRRHRAAKMSAHVRRLSLWLVALAAALVASAAWLLLSPPGSTWGDGRSILVAVLLAAVLAVFVRQEMLREALSGYRAETIKMVDQAGPGVFDQERS